MKKIILLSFVVLAASSVSYATQVTFSNAGKSVVGTGGAATNAAIGKLSTKVALGWLNDANAYSINTQHQQGTKAYGTAFNSTSIYVTDVTVGAAVDEPSASDSSAFNSWTTM